MSTLLRLPALALATFCLIATACHRPTLLIDANANDLHTARTVAAAFYQTYGAQIGLADVPFVTVGMEGGPGYSYDVSHNVLFITPFSHTEFDTQRIIAKACADGREEAIYDELLFRFFTAHQLMHLVYDKLPVPEVDLYDEELRINTMTWLFLEEHGLMSPTLNEALTMSLQLEQQLQSRFPSIEKGEDTAATLLVDDNSSYWYCTAVSLRAAHGYAGTVGSTHNYVSALTSTSLSAEAGR